MSILLIRGTTPTHTFELSLNGTDILRARVIYSQDDIEIVRKETEQCNIEGNTVSVSLTQEETLKFSQYAPRGEVQVRIVSTDEQAYTSDPIPLKIGKCLDNGVL